MTRRQTPKEHLLLMAIDPGRDRDQEQLGGVQDGAHPGIVAGIKHPSGSHLRRGRVFGQDAFEVASLLERPATRAPASLEPVYNKSRMVRRPSCDMCTSSGPSAIRQERLVR